MALDGDFKGEQARKEQAFHDRLRKADEALKAAIAERIKIGAEAARVELSDFATWIPESPPTYNVFTGRRMTASERKECIDAPFLCETYLYYLMGKEDARTVLALFNSVCRVLGIEGATTSSRSRGTAPRKRSESARSTISSISASVPSARAILSQESRVNPAPPSAISGSQTTRKRPASATSPAPSPTTPSAAATTGTTSASSKNSWTRRSGSSSRSGKSSRSGARRPRK